MLYYSQGIGTHANHKLLLMSMSKIVLLEIYSSKPEGRVSVTYVTYCHWKTKSVLVSHLISQYGLFKVH